MPIIYVTTGAWGAGTGTPNSAAQVDGNFYDVDQRIVALLADVAEGKRIDSVTYTSSSMTFHFTDGTSQVIPLPVATLQYAGVWTNSTPYTRTNMITGLGFGLYQVLVDHTTPPLPATFDPDATDETTDANPLYQLWMPLIDVTYDAMVFVPGSLQREPGELLFLGLANRSMRLSSESGAFHAYLAAGNDAPGATDIILSIEKNAIEIGTITFAAGGEIDTEGGQEGEFSLTDTDFIDGDRYALRVTQSDNVEPSGLSVILPFLRTDI